MKERGSVDSSVGILVSVVGRKTAGRMPFEAQGRPALRVFLAAEVNSRGDNLSSVESESRWLIGKTPARCRRYELPLSFRRVRDGFFVRGDNFSTCDSLALVSAERIFVRGANARVARRIIAWVSALEKWRGRRGRLWRWGRA